MRDLHADPERGEVAQGPGGPGREVVPQRDETPEGQAVYVGRGPVPGARGALGGRDGEQPQPARRLPVGAGEQPCPLGGGRRAPPDDVRDRALDDEDMRPQPPPYHRRGQSPHRIEGQRRHPVVALTDRPRRCQQRLVEGVRGWLFGQLEGPPGGRGGPVEHFRIVPSSGVHGPFDDRAVPGEGAGLVEAQDVDRAQVVQRGQPFHHDAVRAGELRGPARQTGGDDDRQHLGRHPDGHRDGERQGPGPLPAQRPARHQHERRGEQHEPDQHPGHPVQRPVEGAPLRLPGPAYGRVVPAREMRARARGHDHGGGAPGGDGAALEAQLAPREHATVRVTRPYVLRDRRRLAGQRRLVHGQPGRAQQPYVRRDQVAGPEPDHVSRNEFGDRDLPGVRRPSSLRAPQDRRGTGGQLAQTVEETFRPMLARGAQHTAHHDQGQDHRGRSPGRDGGRDEPETQQYGGEGVTRAPYEPQGPRNGTGSRDDVLPDRRQPRLGLAVGETARGAVESPQRPEVRLHGGAVPGRARPGRSAARPTAVRR
ncbi:hypothetical protein QFZ49_007393 [Streptomyces turgidiscabies]|uniref:Uncharacterized protein n=1 Tax=Streptomyces turgidiscabies TaxID=85558 RepID=A0ABU0RZJ0_9ACTN|nr:hypothetical protein [Streptomyces turgidiscabies]